MGLTCENVAIGDLIIRKCLALVHDGRARHQASAACAACADLAGIRRIEIRTLRGGENCLVWLNGELGLLTIQANLDAAGDNFGCLLRRIHALLEG